VHCLTSQGACASARPCALVAVPTPPEHLPVASRHRPSSENASVSPTAASAAWSRRPLQPSHLRSTIPSTASSSRCCVPLWADAYSDSLYSPVPKLGSPPRHLTLATSSQPVSRAWPSASVGQAHCNSACLFFLFPFNLFKFNSNKSSNFKNYRKLNDLIKL
jgi:hypothetical protein